MQAIDLDPGVIRQTLGGTLGSLLVGATIALALYGLNCAQCVVFFRQPSFAWKTSSVIIVLWVLETIQIAFCLHALHYDLITYRANILHLAFTNPWTMHLQFLPCSLISCITQHFWIWRIWTLLRNHWRTHIAVAMSILSLVGCGISIAWVTQTKENSWSGNNVINPLLTTFLVLLLINDFLSNFGLCYLVYRSRIGIRQADSALTVLMVYSLNTGVLNCVGSGAMLAFMYLAPMKAYEAATNLVISKIYLCSLLSMLNFGRNQAKEISVSTSGSMRMTSAIGTESGSAYMG